MRRNPEHHLRARGNLTYLQFIRLVKNLWEGTHPDIPLIPSGNDDVAQYPCILYGIELRQTHSSDPKPRYRETIRTEDNKAFVVVSQKYNSIVSFRVMAQTSTGSLAGAEIADELIEGFEEFMQQMVPVFKEMGASEFVYSRRFADSEDPRPGEGVVSRKVAYMLTTERVTATEVDKLESIIINAGIMQDPITSHDGSTKFNVIKARYYVQGYLPPGWFQKQEDIDNNLITVPRTGFLVGDRVYLQQMAGKPFPTLLSPGYYRIANIEGELFATDVKYELMVDGEEGATPEIITDYGTGTEDEHGRVFYGHISYVPEFDIVQNLLNL